LGDNVAIQRIYDESVYGSQVVSAQDQLGKTYLLNPSLSAKTQRKGIMINRGAIGFNSRALTSSGGSHILTWLAETATHEPFHYDSKIVEIDELLKANSVYHYTHMSGFSMFGEKTNDGEKVINFGTLDELVTRYVHRKLIGSRMSDLSDNYGAGEIGWTDLVAREIFAPLGYTTPESILELQRGKGFVGLLNRLAKFRNGNKQAAYVELVDINNQLFSGTGGLS